MRKKNDLEQFLNYQCFLHESRKKFKETEMKEPFNMYKKNRLLFRISPQSPQADELLADIRLQYDEKFPSVVNVKIQDVVIASFFVDGEIQFNEDILKVNKCGGFYIDLEKL